MKLIVIPKSRFEDVLPVIREQEALGLHFIKDERTTYTLGEYPMWCYKLFFNDGSPVLTYENRCQGKVA